MASGTISLSSSSSAWHGYIKWSSTQDVASNSSTVTAELFGYKSDGYTTGGNTNGYSGSLKIGSQTKTFNYTNEYNDSSGTGVSHATLTAVVYHDNSTGAGSVSISGSVTGPSGTSLSGKTLSGSKTVSLGTIARKSTISVGNGTLGSQQTITADRKNSSFVHTLTWACSTKSGTIATLSSNTSWNFTPDLELAELIPNATTVNMTFTLSTYSGSTLIGSSSKTVSMSIPSTMIPNCGMTVEDATTCFAELGEYLQYQSKLNIKVTGLGAYGSTIKAFEVKADGQTYNTTRQYPQNYDEYTLTTGVLQSEGNQKVTAKITDSRGKTATVTVDIEIQSYNAPRITELLVHRCNSDGTENQSGQYAKVTYSYSVSSASSGTISLKYKKSSDSTWTTINLPGGQSANHANRIFPADDGSAYDIELVISDSYGTASRRTALSTGYTIMHFPASGKGVSIGGVATSDGFNVYMPAHFFGGVITDILNLDSGDCNTILSSGTYFIGIYGTHRPPSNLVGWLTVTASADGSYCFQQYITFNGQMWIRYRENGSWKEWCNTITYF